MHVDPITLADLEVLAARDGGPGILDMVDSTRTRVGRKALRRRLTEPLGTVEEIREVQAALPRLIGPHPISHITEEASDSLTGPVRWIARSARVRS